MCETEYVSVVCERVCVLVSVCVRECVLVSVRVCMCVRECV